MRCIQSEIGDTQGFPCGSGSRRFKSKAQDSSCSPITLAGEWETPIIRGVISSSMASVDCRGKRERNKAKYDSRFNGLVDRRLPYISSCVPGAIRRWGLISSSCGPIMLTPRSAPGPSRNFLFESASVKSNVEASGRPQSGLRARDLP